MSFRKFTSILVLSILTSCKSSSDSTKKVDCYTYTIKNVDQISESEYTLKINGLKKDYVQLRFCTHNPFVATQILYDNFGHWNEIIYEENTKNPLLIWEDVYFDKTKSKVNILSSSSYDKLSWILIYNNDSFDFLSSESKHKKIIVEYFISEINTNTNHKESRFYEMYWKSVNPKRWKEIMKYRRINGN